MSQRLDDWADSVCFAEQLMKIGFSAEQKRILGHMESADILACPGSGKTTTLVAKLVIMARMGLKGLCVLSHTNAAREEVEGKLGRWAGTVCAYPNFVDTIQSFVHRFLAIPEIVNQFGMRPWAIDDDSFARVAMTKFFELPRNIQGCLTHLKRGRAVLEDLRFTLDTELGVGLRGGNALPYPVTHVAHPYLIDVKMQLAREGCFAYEDAFALAYWYLRRVPGIANAIGSRFPFVFVDEMQDTNPIQCRVLEALFAGHKFIQRFGDTNQSIFSDSESTKASAWVVAKPTLSINTSNRISPSIARLSQNVCLHPVPLTGNPHRADLPHTVFLYNSESIHSVFPEYAKLVSRSCALSPSSQVVIVGARRKPNPKGVTISSYWPDFVADPVPSRSSHSCLADHFVTAGVALRTTGDCQEARRILLAGLVRVLRLEKVRHPITDKPFTETTLVDCLTRRGDDSLARLNRSLLKSCSMLVQGVPPDPSKLQKFVEIHLSPLLPNSLLTGEKTLQFVWGTPSGGLLGPTAKCPNVYEYATDRSILRIPVTTVHQVKGKTHQATLLVETYSHKHYDLQTILPFLLGDRPKLQPLSQKILSVVYVAMTRPTDLLCLAMHREHVPPQLIDRLKAVGWDVRDLTISDSAHRASGTTLQAPNPEAHNTIAQSVGT